MVKVIKSGIVPTYTTICEECGSSLIFNRSDVCVPIAVIKCPECKCGTHLYENWKETKSV